MTIWAGIDLGTSGVKTVLMDDAQVILATASSPLDVIRPQAGWSEQNAADWQSAAWATMDMLAASHPTLMAELAGIGLSGQMHGATLLDAGDQPLRPAILWNDGRSGAECDALEARADFRGIGGNLVMPGFTAPKLEWVRNHEPETFAKVAKVLLPKDYLRLCLSGDHVSEMSDSAGTLWLDVKRREWSSDLVEATGLTLDHMPSLVEGSAVSGTLRAELCTRWGIAKPPVIAGGGGDNAASAAGVGTVAPGSGFLSLGTSGVLFVATAGYAPNTDHAVHAFCHAVPDTWHQMGVILAATDSLNWLSAMTGADAQLLAEEAARAAPDHGVLFLPYLSGERTPHNAPNARGSFSGLSAATTRADLARAVLEGVGYAFADCRSSLEAAGTEVGPVYALGGGANSEFWLQTIANITGLTCLRPQAGDFGAAFGAARLAMVAGTGAPIETVLTPAPVASQITPDAGMADHYAARLEKFRATYPMLNGSNA